MTTVTDLLASIQGSDHGLILSDWLGAHPEVARRTAQRWIAQLSDGGQIVAVGEARSRRYYAAAVPAPVASPVGGQFPAYIPLSADSRDILEYIDLPLQARKPVGYQHEFLDAYVPNVTAYLPEPLRRQLHRMGRTSQAVEPAGTYSRTTLKALSENLLPNPADEGRLRQHAVEIGLSVYRPLAAPAQIEEALDQVLAKASAIVDPFEQSFFVMVHLPYLQPFADINKRTSRLAANLPLFRANLCPLTFLDVPEQAYSRAILGVYELTRVELLRDLYVWAYERSTQEYLAIRQELAEPDPMRLAWRSLIKTTIHDVVCQPDADPLTVIEQLVEAAVPASERANVQALIVEELRRLHEGVLARYGLRLSQFNIWKAVHST
ncbi:MAG: Fic family protein [Pseudomonas sp.]|uniref:Fic family protein n=1 Tax=Pseudomonas abieticivorans TaxID=2931382 RepID=UPI0020C14406|nr:Fic family protein [Pseudomonas sp. PIA16]MDE1165058.1 Fic family protein [Pseudomonas sp.]